MPLMNIVTRAWVAALLILSAVGDAAGDVDYARDVRPILQARCYECHGADEQNGGFRADSKKHALNPTESGKTPVVPGDVAKSDLVRRIRSNDEDVKMPPTD